VKTPILNGIEKEALSPRMIGLLSGTTVGGTAGALIDKDNRLRGGLIGAGAGGGLGYLSGSLISKMRKFNPEKFTEGYIKRHIPDASPEEIRAMKQTAKQQADKALASAKNIAQKLKNAGSEAERSKIRAEAAQDYLDSMGMGNLFKDESLSQMASANSEFMRDAVSGNLFKGVDVQGMNKHNPGLADDLLDILRG